MTTYRVVRFDRDTLTDEWSYQVILVNADGSWSEVSKHASNRAAQTALRHLLASATRP